MPYGLWLPNNSDSQPPVDEESRTPSPRVTASRFASLDIQALFQMFDPGRPLPPLLPRPGSLSIPVVFSSPAPEIFSDRLRLLTGYPPAIFREPLPFEVLSSFHLAETSSPLTLCRGLCRRPLRTQRGESHDTSGVQPGGLLCSGITFRPRTVFPHVPPPTLCLYVVLFRHYRGIFISFSLFFQLPDEFVRRSPPLPTSHPLIPPDPALSVRCCFFRTLRCSF